jgi:hypothetical protein
MPSTARTPGLSTKVKSGQRFLAQPERQRIIQWYGDSRTFDARAEAPYQVIFIDGGHAYDVVAHDTREGLKLVGRSDGAVLWHDATHFGTGIWLRDFLREGHAIHRIEGTDIAFLRFVAGDEVVYAA